MKFPKPKTQNPKPNSDCHWNQKLFPILVFLLIFNGVFAQNQHPEPVVLGGLVPERGQVFEQGYGGANDEAALGMTKTDIGVTLCGWEENSTGNKRAVVYLIDSIGELLKKYTYNNTGSNHQIVNSIFADGVGGYYLAGRSVSADPSIDAMTDTDTAWVFRIDSLGQIMWQNKYGPTNTNTNAEVGMSLLDKGNGIFWLLTNVINTQGYNQVRVREIDSTGTVLTTKTHGSATGNTYSYKLIENQSGNMILLANDLSSTAEPMVYELDDEGDEITSNSFAQSVSCKAFGISELPTGGYVLAGETNGYDKGAIVIELDTNLNQGYVYVRDNADDEYFRDIVADSTGAIAVGATENMGEGGFDGFLVHVDNNGDSIMTETLGRELDDEISVAVVQAAGKGGGVLAAGISGGSGGNSYLIKATKYGNRPCPLPRFLLVDDFVVGTVTSLDSVNSILGNTTQENNLINYAKLDGYEILVLFGLNYVFEPGNRNKTHGGIKYREIVNKFIVKARRNGLTCSIASIVDDGFTAFDGVGLYNLTDSIRKHNYDLAGKIAFFFLEHEFWNPRTTRAISGPRAFKNPGKTPLSQLNSHFTALYQDHKNFLDTLNLRRYQDANIMAVHDYIDKLYLNFDTAGFVNNYSDTNTVSRALKAKELETRSNAIFFVNYQRFDTIQWGLDFLISNAGISSYHAKRRLDRHSYFGKNPKRNTFFFSLFSAEYHLDSTFWCGPNKNAIYTDYLGLYFLSSFSGGIQNNLWGVEDTFIKQYVKISYDTIMTTADSVVLSGFGWFKYSCISQMNNTTNKTDLQICPTIIYFSAFKPEESVSVENSDPILFENIKVFPNPTNGSLTVSSENLIKAIYVYTSSGALVEQRSTERQKITLDVNSLQSGVYFLKIETIEGFSNFKLIKQ